MSPASTGSLLVTVIANEPGAIAEPGSAAVIAAICTSFLFGGQRLQPATGMPEIVGGVLSMLMWLTVAGWLVFPAASVQMPDAD